MKTLPYLPEGRRIEYVNLDNPFMHEAKWVAENLSTEQRHPTGAVVVKDGEIIGKGGNQSGLKNKTLRKLHNEKGVCVRKLIHAKTGTLYWTCPGCASPKSHAEQVATKDAQKKGYDVTGADLYLYGHWWCCESCWSAMIDAGINNVYLLENADELFS